MRRSKTERTRPRRRPWRGFTLVELLIVMVIIGIILAFILSASLESLRLAEERKTQALISKIESGLADRFEAVYGTRATANSAHANLGKIWSATGGFLEANSRAQLIARFDYLKSELPDVFVLQTALVPEYPLNFAAQSFPGNITNSGFKYGNYMLPLGVGVDNDPTNTSYGAWPISGVDPPENTGIFGASYAARGALTKQLVEVAIRGGAAASSPSNAGYDGVDNNSNGMIDELGETGTGANSVSVAITGLLSNHTHKTARSEVLYALLVEGQGPFGSLFSRDDFNDSEVKDTDGDGLLEFIDAWGEPVQFFRWPIGHVSDLADLLNDLQKGPVQFSSQQRGLMRYLTSFDTRDQNPLDPGQSLMDPAWWAGVAVIPGAFANDSSPFGTVQGNMSGSALWFQNAFFALADPNAPYFVANPPPANSPGPWDRGLSTSSFYARRAYYSKYLVVSGGPDKVPGVATLDLQTLTALTEFQSFNLSTVRYVGGTGSNGATVSDVLVENQAASANPYRTLPYLSFGASPVLFPPVGDAMTLAIIEAGKDDISNHNVAGPGGSTQ